MEFQTTRTQNIMAATILIIDDHPSVRMLLGRVLDDAGYQVYEAANGRQGLEQFEAQPVDLVITDLDMPDTTGLEVLLELTRILFNVKVIAIRGGAGDHLQRARFLGARQIFSKPLDLAALLQGIQDELHPGADLEAGEVRRNLTDDSCKGRSNPWTGGQVELVRGPFRPSGSVSNGNSST